MVTQGETPRCVAWPTEWYFPSGALLVICACTWKMFPRVGRIALMPALLRL